MNIKLGKIILLLLSTTVFGTSCGSVFGNNTLIESYILAFSPTKKTTLTSEPKSPTVTSNSKSSAVTASNVINPISTKKPVTSNSKSSAVTSGNEIKPEMILVQGGTFQMGSNESEAESDEKTVHSVTVDSFYIGKYEVTQKEYKGVMGINPSRFKGDNLPVEQVSWNDAIAFCNARSRKEALPEAYNSNGELVNKGGYRLPTEAEWEFAARGGINSKDYKYSGSNDPGAVAWYSDNSGNTTQDVGTKQANELGIYDLSGNVYEWVSDWYDEKYYSKSPTNNPYNSVSGSSRVFRGGSWGIPAKYVRVADRGYFYPDYRVSNLGFRLSRTAP